MSSYSEVLFGGEWNKRGSVAVTGLIIIFVETWNGIRAPGTHNRHPRGGLFSEVAIPFRQVQWKFSIALCGTA